MDPAGGIVQVFAADGVEWQALTPDTRFWAVIDAFDEGGEDPGVRVCGASSEQDRVRVPGEGSDGASDWLLKVLGDPPVVLFFEVADSDYAGAGADGEFALRGRPADKGGSAVDAEKDKSRLPSCGGGFPDVGVSVLVRVSIKSCLGSGVSGHTLGTSDNHATVWGDVDACDCLIVTLQLILRKELVA